MYSDFKIPAREVLEMTARVKMVFDITAEEKRWYEEILQPNQTKIALFRQLLDEYAEKNNLPPRPGSQKN